MTNPSKRPAMWRDPLSLSFEVHRRVLLARLRRHQRRHPTPAPIFGRP
ncbi:hypothetical protein SBI67_04605 [Mycolicibacterium sp. 120266]|nr:hypothetical protein [Mycolicibacterium sp. 120266]MDX1871391.1 hypothetical protein [Mycolicibacterium sp. 120266]